MATTEFDRESTATSRRVEKRDFSNSFDDAERYSGDRVSNAFVNASSTIGDGESDMFTVLLNQRKEIEEKRLAFEHEKWYQAQQDIQADREIEKKKLEVEELKYKVMMLTAQVQQLRGQLSSAQSPQQDFNLLLCM